MPVSGVVTVPGADEEGSEPVGVLILPELTQLDGHQLHALERDSARGTVLHAGPAAHALVVVDVVRALEHIDRPRGAAVDAAIALGTALVIDIEKLHPASSILDFGEIYEK